jgi:hypothetical protein
MFEMSVALKAWPIDVPPGGGLVSQGREEPNAGSQASFDPNEGGNARGSRARINFRAGKVKPVFQAMLANATRLCDAKFGSLYLHEGGALRMVASHNVPPAFGEARRQMIARQVRFNDVGTLVPRITVQLRLPAFRHTPLEPYTWPPARK